MLKHLRSLLRYSLCWAPALLALAICWPAYGNPIGGVTDDCTKGGTINEWNSANVPMHMYTNITDKDNGGQVVSRIDDGVVDAGGVAQVHVPAGAGVGIVRADAFNESEAVGPVDPPPGGGGPGAGARQITKFEALFRYPTPGKYYQGSIYDFMNQAYPGKTLRLPDLWVDTNEDGRIAAGDVLYELIDLNAYTQSGALSMSDLNARFTPGQVFVIQNGLCAALPGAMFSTTDWTFSEDTGYTGTPANCDGYTYTYHELNDVPEPSTFVLLGVGAVTLLAWWRRRRTA